MKTLFTEERRNSLRESGFVSNPLLGVTIDVVGGVDAPFYTRLLQVYGKLLSPDYVESRRHWTITVNGEPAGVISVGKGDYLQIALLPEHTGKGIGAEALRRFLSVVYPMREVRWVTSKVNVPSLKLLRSMGGGLFRSPPHSKEVEGVFYMDGRSVSTEMQTTLDKFLQ